MNIKNEKELYKLIKEYFGYKGEMLYCDSGKKEVAILLYDSFLFKCNINDRYGRFGAAIITGGYGGTITKFLGEICSSNSDEESIRKSLKIVDDYCRLRLPDKYLEAYYEAYGKERYDDDEDL